MTANNLVIVRAGKNSLHNHWLDQAPETRSWDLIVSYFDKEAFDSHQEQPGVKKLYYEGGKWSGIYDAIERTNSLRSYEYFWCPDDDIYSKGENINEMFITAKKWNLELCQPALTNASFFFHFIVTQCHAFDLRFTNFVEVMLPCISCNYMIDIMPIIKSRHTGVGLDLIWGTPTLNPKNAVAVLDKTPMAHTRPVGAVLKGVVNSMGQPQRKMRNQLLEDFGFHRRPDQVALAGVVQGELIDDPEAVYKLMIDSYEETAIHYQNPALALERLNQIKESYKNQIAALNDFTITRKDFNRLIAEENCGVIEVNVEKDRNSKATRKNTIQNGKINLQKSNLLQRMLNIFSLK